jgi:hypothetical protein
MSKIEISPYARLASTARKLIASASDMASAVEARADEHASRLDAMRAKLARDEVIADGVARHSGTV